MKKYIALILALVMCLSLCACGKKIELTADNASTYLDIYAGASKDHGNADVTHFGDLGWLSNKYRIQFNVKGVSSNFNYNDVGIKAKITITYTRYENLCYNRGFYDMEVYDTQSTTRLVEVKTDIAGNAVIQLDPLVLGEFYASDNSVKVEVEIIEISGSVSPV